ncbi:hypothetical protein NC652_017226 [Populus alba x Populus x berolinensis]|nr:hypothetical protein NC652_017226 [Populus alba x Populus x berolinensis]
MSSNSQLYTVLWRWKKGMAKEYGGCVATKVPKLSGICVEKNFELHAEYLERATRFSILVILWADTEYCKRKFNSLNLSGEGFGLGLSGKASISQLSGCHKFIIQHPPLRCNVPGSRGLFYDVGISYYAPPHLISEGPIYLFGFSLDGEDHCNPEKSHEIQFFHRDTGKNFCHNIDKWKLNVRWYVYTHEMSLGLFLLQGIAMQDIQWISELTNCCFTQIRFYQDAVVQQGFMPPKKYIQAQIAISVVDNLLLIHLVVILYDIFVESSSTISASTASTGFRGFPSLILLLSIYRKRW